MEPGQQQVFWSVPRDWSGDPPLLRAGTVVYQLRPAGRWAPDYRWVGTRPGVVTRGCSSASQADLIDMVGDELLRWPALSEVVWSRAGDRFDAAWLTDDLIGRVATWVGLPGRRAELERFLASC